MRPSLMSMENESLRVVRTAVRPVLGRLGQASVPLIQSFNVQALHQRKSRKLVPWYGRLGQAYVPLIQSSQIQN